MELITDFDLSFSTGLKACVDFLATSDPENLEFGPIRSVLKVQLADGDFKLELNL